MFGRARQCNLHGRHNDRWGQRRKENFEGRTLSNLAGNLDPAFVRAHNANGSRKP